MPRPRHLRLVRDGPDASPPRPAPDRRDVALVASLLAVNLVPVAGELAGHGRWGAGTVGLATAGVLVAGRELLRELRAGLAARRPAPTPLERPLPGPSGAPPPARRTRRGARGRGRRLGRPPLDAPYR